MTGPRPGWVWCALVGYLLCLGWLTLSPVDAVPGYDALNLRPGHSISRQITDPVNPWQHRLWYVVGNTLMFVPLVILLRGWFRWSFSATLVVVLGLSLSIELAQYLLRHGRVADIDDVLLNVTGAVAALMGIAVIHALLDTRRRWERDLRAQPERCPGAHRSELSEGER